MSSVLKTLINIRHLKYRKSKPGIVMHSYNTRSGVQGHP